MTRRNFAITGTNCIAPMLVYAVLLVPTSSSSTEQQYSFNTGNPYEIVLLDGEFTTGVQTARQFKFQNLVSKWRDERGAISSMLAISALPAYQSIIGMGEDVVPLIVAQLKSEGDEPDHWFWALSAITGANPVKAEDRGYTNRMAHAWIQWAEENGYAG